MSTRLRKVERFHQDVIDNSELLRVLNSFRNGDVSVRLPSDKTGIAGKIYDALNDVIENSDRLTKELERVSHLVGKEGKLGHRAKQSSEGGVWAQSIDSVNNLITDLVQPNADFGRVIGAVARGDLSQRMSSDIDGRQLKGEFLRTVNTVNTMVDQLSTFTSEVIRVAREVGTEGKLGGQAAVKGLGGAWRDLTGNVNSMANNLTSQVRNIAQVTTAVAMGDLSKKITVDVRGEMSELKNTINTMVDQLNSFASEVTRVAREVGTEGKLGGQANVAGATGTWRDLTDNVNRLAANLTTQVRAIAEVATAVTKWDLSRSITVEAAGEVASLKDNINEMIRNLKETTDKSSAQDWLKTNIARFTRLLQGQRDLSGVSNLILSELAPLVSVQHGVFYLNESNDGEADLRLLASYAFNERRRVSDRFRLREGLVGQAAFEKKRILITEVPSDYVQISSGLGEGRPLNIVVLPVLYESDVRAVIELASFQRFTEIHLTFLDQLAEIIGLMLNTINATMRTEELLKQSQALATELTSRQSELTETNTRLQEQARTLQDSEERLREQQEELQQTNEELEEKAQQLSRQNTEVGQKNAEIENARRSLEEKAEQLALSSKYKSEFLANMSHELRTPLNSMLILSKLLMDNSDRNLLDKQVEYAETIHSSGSDLLSLINEILDLSKIEAGVMQIEISRVQVSEIEDFVQRTFQHVADQKELEFQVESAANVPLTIMTDEQRLQQILKNLLSNAFKFTEQGEVKLRVETVTGGWSRSNQTLNRADVVFAFAVRDTGIGIAADKHQVVFEAFQQAEGGTTRKFGGTGLGLSISRELARLLGGEIRLVSEPGKGSTFTLYLPQSHPYDKPEKPPKAQQAAPPPNALDNGGSPASLLSDAEMYDDRNHLRADDEVLLIIEDDMRFGRIMLDLAHQSGFKGVLAGSGEEALRLASKFQPQAITLDLHLPGIHGWSVLDRLKHDPRTRHIPVQVISAFDERAFSLKLGAIGFLKKPVTHEDLLEAFSSLRGFLQKRERTLLVVEDNEVQRNAIVELIGNGDVRTIAVATGNDALNALREEHVDCVVIDLGLPDMTGYELIDRIRTELGLKDLRIVIYTGRDLTRQEETALRRVAETVIIKEARSLERLLEETTLFLHRSALNLPEARRRQLDQAQATDPLLAGKTLLIVDDDVRNIFALTSLFERYNMNVFYAENGEDGLEKLKEHPEVDAALIDIMMPEMDGYETIRRIRGQALFSGLPIIALTAKAMKGDREACLEAGATDYISKPADTDHLVSLMRVHMARKAR